VAAASPPARVAFRVRDAARALPLRDPESGETLLVVPLGELGRGLDVEHEFVEFRALPSVQGLVIRPNADDLAVESTAAGVTITRPKGLVLSSAGDRLLGRAPGTLHRLFDFAQWRAAPGDTFLEQRRALEQAIAAAPAGSRSEPRLALAHFYFANLFGAEALGVIEAIERDDPALAADPAVRAMKGAACLMAGERACAAQELGQMALDKEPEAALWRASLSADGANAEQVARDFTTGVSLLPAYPKPLRNRMALQAATALLDTEQPSAARALIDLVLKDDPPQADLAMALYLDGRRQQQEGAVDRALELYDRVAAMDDRPSRARALRARALALFDAGRASRAETIKTLDGLRFAWRGDRDELQLLRRLGELKIAEGDYHGGIEALRDALSNFPDDPAAPALKQRLAAAFAEVFLGPAAADVPPLKALALYDEFHDLAAPAQGPAIVRKLVDRLVAVDLLDRAADLLDQQLKARLTGTDQPRVATQLALLRLLDHKPELALQALQVEVGRELPVELARQREQLRARALAELDRPQDALAAISADQSRDADRLRADIAWRMRDWKAAGKVFARLVGDPPADGKPDAEAARLVLSWAAALVLDGDQAGLQKLRDAWAKPMAATPMADAFDVVAGDTGGDKDADPRAIARRIAQIGELQSFMASQRSRLATEKLSAIN
jgi:tetratricopeptide (TPR) repeat protein